VVNDFTNALFFDGTIDEVGIWNRSLSSSEVSELYNGGSGASYPFPDVLTLNITQPANGTTISPDDDVEYVIGGSEAATS
jgi:hypothetical protein